MPTRSTFPCTRPGSTLAEIIVVVAIIAISLSFVQTGGGKSRERSLGETAQMEITNIFSAEKSRKLATGSYLLAPDTAGINSGLGLSINNVNFSYRVTAAPAGFKITATRGDGKLCAGKTLTLDAAGGEIKKDCDVW